MWACKPTPKKAQKMEASWLTKHDKHLLVLSSAGKPVFTLHDDMFDGGGGGLAICSLFCAIASKTQNKLQEVCGARFKLVFKHRGELLLVGVTSSYPQMSTSAMLVELDLLYSHILFHVTLPALDHLFKTNPSYDLSHLLGGTDYAARMLVKCASVELGVMLKALPVLPLMRRPDLRGKICALLDAARKDCATFAFLIASPPTEEDNTRAMLVCGLGPKGKTTTSKYYGVHSTTDFLLLANFVLRSTQSEVMETWTPLCLPDFNTNGHFHCYASSITDQPGLFLILCTTNPSLEHFHLCAQRKRDFSEALLALLDKQQPLLQAYEENTPIDLFASKLALHVAVRISGQYVESKQAGLNSPFRNIKAEYITARYESLKIHARTEDAARLVCDAQMRDLAVFSKERDMEIYALFPPLTAPSQVEHELAGIRTEVLKHKFELYSLPEQL